MKHLLISLSFAAATSIACAQVTLLKDINQTSTSDGAYPGPVTEMDGSLYYTASNPVIGYELYRTVIATNTTTLVKDIAVGPNNSGISNLIVHSTPSGNRLFFVANDGFHGYELWSTNGTAAGTSMVIDLNPGAGHGVGSGVVNPMVKIGGAFYFTGNDGTTGNEPWKSDGTPQGTVQIKDINTSGSSDPLSFTEAAGTVFFAANNGTSGYELWTTDGNPGNAIMLEVSPGSAGSLPRSLVAFGPNLYFAADHAIYGVELWKSNGVSNTLVSDIEPGDFSSNPQFITVFGSNLIFSATSLTNGIEVWMSTGATGNATLLKDIETHHTADWSSEPNDFIVIGPTCYFTAKSHNDVGRELWSTDGTTAGTNIVKDIYPGTSEGVQTGYAWPTAVGNTLYFVAQDGVTGKELWKTDGTEVGTVMAADINEIAGEGSVPNSLRAVGSTIYMTANGGNGMELWKSTGTGATKVVDLRSGTNSSILMFGGDENFFYNGTTTLIIADDGSIGRELWKTDGTTAGTLLVKDIAPGAQGSSILFLGAIGGITYFSANDNTNGAELWKTDGTSAGTQMIDLNPGPENGYAYYPLVVGSTMYFTANIDGDDELWKIDANGPSMVKDIDPTGSSAPGYGKTQFGSFIYFSANDGVNGKELWRSDGTAANTVMVKDINPSGSSNPGGYYVYNNELFFYADDGTTGYELWKSDGTPGNATLVKDINPAGSGDPGYFCAYNNMLYFEAVSANSDRELWRSDGTGAGTQLFIDSRPGPAGGTARNLNVLNGKLTFTTNDGVNGEELWSTDGTVNGTTMIKNIAPNPGTLGPTFITRFDDRLFFLAYDETDLNLWVTDGRPNATVKVPAANTATPKFMYRGGSKIYTTYTGLGVDREPYVIDPSLIILDPKSQASSIVFSGVTETTLTVSWTAAQGPPTGYLVIRKTDSSPAGVPIDGITYAVGDALGDGMIAYAGPATTFDETTLSAGTVYFYDVYSYNGSGASINYLTANSPVESSSSTLLSPPVSTVATGVSQTGFTANWNAVTGATAYRLDVSEDNFATLVTGYNDLAVTSNSKEISGLKEGTTYSYRVRAESGVGSTASSNVITQLTMPANPVISLSTPTQDGFTVTWPAVMSATSYVAEVSASAAFASIALTNSGAVSPLLVADGASISPGTVYFVRLRAANASGSSGNSNSPSILTLPLPPNLLVAANITSTSFKIDWDASTGTVNGYHLDVSDNDFVGFITGYGPKVLSAGTTEETIDGLAPNKVYKFRVRAFNDSGDSDNSTVRTAQTTIAEASNPLVLATPTFPTTIKGSPVTVSVDVSGGKEPRTLKMSHRKITESGFSEVTLAQKAGSTTVYETTVTTEMVDQLGLEFYFTASDADGITKESPSHHFIYQSIDASSNQVVPFATAAFDGKMGTYQMFSVPYDLTDANISNIFEPALNGFDLTQWRLLHYQAGGYIEYPDQLKKIEMGKGYWFNTKQNEFSVKLGAATVSQVNHSTSFTITLAKGWNQLGNPYPFNLDWNVIVSANGTAGLNSLWTFENGAYTKRDVLAAWKGGFVFSDNSGSITFPISAKTNSAGRSLNDHEEITPDEEAWTLPVTLRANDLVQHSAIGMHPDASRSKDRHDEIAIPRFVQWLELTTRHDEFFAPNFSADIVPTSDEHRWDFTARSSSTNSQSVIEWDADQLAAARSAFVLIDNKNGTWVDMKANSSYAFTLEGPHQFTILYSRDGEVNPDLTLLGDAYPNPYERQVNIPVLAAADEEFIAIEIYDVFGRRIKSLEARTSKPGLHVLQWDGVDDSGDDVGQGLLLYRIAGRGANQTKRMIRK